MNLFRSEEHAKAWSGFKTDSEGGILKLDVFVELFAGNLFTRRLDRDYVSNVRDYLMEMAIEFHKLGAYWQLK